MDTGSSGTACEAAVRVGSAYVGSAYVGSEGAGRLAGVSVLARSG